MMRFPFLRNNKPMPKKGTLEYKQMQERLLARRNPKTPESAQEPLDTLAVGVPKVLKWILLFSTVPVGIGIVGVLKSDYYTEEYQRYLGMASYWIAGCSTFLGASLVGLEFMKFNPYAYSAASKFFTGPGRIYVSLAQLPLAMLCVHAAHKQDWKLYFGYLLGQAGTTLFFLSSSQRGLVPQWLANVQCPWILFCQITMLFMIYSLFSKEAHTERMKQLQENIMEGTYEED
mmetsp:Transcript_14573/g.21244  ORF Transcript_14573/g.21244 Transcript_14573/m.21244 type:complete len:231 (-) Transcript_14573:3238-3930(-)